MSRAYHSFHFGAFIVAGMFSGWGKHAALALGDGTVCLLPSVPEPEPQVVSVHRGTALSLARDISLEAFLSGGEDGRFVRLTVAGAVEELDCFEGWVDHVTASPMLGLRACSVGKRVYLYRKDGRCIASLEHGSTVGGVAFSTQGDRLAVAHYGGLTVWKADRGEWKAEEFKWRGSHIGVSWSPDDRFLITSMQENALHGWQLQDRMDMQMSGYPRKIRSFVWSCDGSYLVTTGTNRAVCWPFRGKNGPMGKKPLEVGHGGSQPATVVAAHPFYPYVAVGFQDGLTLLTALEAGSPCLPLRHPGHSPVTVLAFAPDGCRLLFGDEAGEVIWFNMPAV